MNPEKAEELPEKLTFTASGKTIILIFVFNEYSSANLNSDLKVLIDNYSKKKMTLDEPDMKLYKEKSTIEALRAYSEKTGIPYPYFRQTVASFMARIFQKVIEENPQVIPPDAPFFEIQIKISHEPDMSWYGAYNEEYRNKKKKIKDFQHVYLEYTGIWLLNTIVVPWIIKQRIDYPLVYKFVQNELSHHSEWINNMYRLEDYARKRIRTISRRMGNWSLFYLYLVFENLRVEGVQEFNDKRNTQRIDVHMDWITEFRRLVEELIKKRSIQAASSFYEKNLSQESHKSTYYVGRLMAQTITLGIALDRAIKGDKQIGLLVNQIKLIVPGGKIFSLEDINAIMGANKTFQISRIPEQKINVDNIETSLMEIALNEMLRVRYREFIRMYEGACGVLGIEVKNRIVTYAWFDGLKKRATDWYTEERLKKAVEAGFVPTNYPGDYWE